MRTVSMKSVCDRALQRVGLDPSTVPAATILALGAYIDEAVRHAWEWSDWPEIMRIEERALRQAFDSSVTYQLNDEVFYSITLKYYRCIATNTGFDPTNTLYWEPVAVSATLALAVTGATPMGKVFGLFTSHPGLVPNAARVPFVDLGDSVALAGPVGATVWVQFRRVSPEFTRLAYDAAATYQAGAVVYDSTTGECYASVSGGVGLALTDADEWTRQEIPLYARDAVVRWAAAQLKREDGMDLTAATLEAQSLEALQDEADKRLQTPALR